MIGHKRLANFVDCVVSVVENGVLGDVIETGVWRGGACIAARGVLDALNDRSRKVFVADSFQGLPAPDSRYPVDAGDRHHTFKELAVSQETVKANFQKFGLLDDRVVFLPGWFEHTLPKAVKDGTIGVLSVIRLDGDMYSSTIQALEALYPRLATGGFCIVDDYALPGAKKATDDFRRAHGILDPIHTIDWTGVYWQCS
jgi:O-methyltransferase